MEKGRSSSFSPSSLILFPVHYQFSLSNLSIFIILSSQVRSSVVNVVLIFNDSLIILAPSAPILLSVHYQFHLTLFFLYSTSISFSLFLSSPYTYSFVNVVLIFNDSPTIFAPSDPIVLSVHHQFHSSYFFLFPFHYLIIIIQIQCRQCSINL